MLASGCLFFFLLSFLPVPLWRHCAEVVIDAGGLCRAPPPSLPPLHCARAACQPAFGCFIYRWTSGPTQQARSVFASSYRIISRRTSWRLRSLAGGCSDCQKHLKSSNLERILESVVIFMGNRENRRTVGWLSLACRSVWIFDISFCEITNIDVHDERQRTSHASCPNRLVFYHVPFNHRRSDAPIVQRFSSSPLHSRGLWTAVLLIIWITRAVQKAPVLHELVLWYVQFALSVLILVHEQLLLCSLTKVISDWLLFKESSWGTGLLF